MLRQGERKRIRMKDVRVPEIGPAKVACEEQRHVLHAPSEDPHVEERIAKVTGHVGGHAERYRPRHHQRQRGVYQQDAPRAHAFSFSARYSSSNNTWMMAAVGTASSAPTKPSNWLPIASETMTVTALRPTVSPITLGTRTLFSTSCKPRQNTATPSARPGETVKATPIAGIAESRGPTIGIISPTPAMTASTKK